MKNSSLILGGAWVTLCLAVVLTGMALRLSPVEMTVMSPKVFPSLVVPLALIFSAGAALLLWIGSGHARGLLLQKPLAELILFFPILFAYIWLVMPANGFQLSDKVILAALAGTAWWLIRGSKLPQDSGPSTVERSWSWGPFWLWDLGLVLLPILLGWAYGVKPDFRGSGFSLLLYPFYALVQLGVFLVIPASRLQKFGLKQWQAALGCSLIFGLVHAPNPVVMPVTIAAMFLWARQYLAGRRVWQLAVVMGLAATAFTQFLADDFTGHMRVGPGYLQSLAAETLAMADYSPEQLQPEAFLELIYPETVGRQITSEELEIWVNLITRARRTTMAWQFFTSDEYAAKAAANGWPPPPPEEIHWADYRPEWRSRIFAYDSNEYWAKCGGHFPGFTKCLYRDILQRRASADEDATWTSALTYGQRRSLAALLLDHSRQWHASPFSGMTLLELRFTR